MIGQQATRLDDENYNKLKKSISQCYIIQNTYARKKFVFIVNL